MSSSFRLTSLAVLSALALPLLTAEPASAVLVTVGGTDYDVTISTTSYNASSGDFKLPPAGQMPWWGDEALASDFALEVFSQLGPGWDPDYAPVFPHGTTVSQVLGIAQSLTDINDQIDVTPAMSSTVSYAIATGQSVPVPGPLPLFGAAAFYGWSCQLRQRIRTRP
jgi:hypothetical protein